MRKKRTWQKFERGEIVRLDKDHANTSLVRVLGQSPELMYTTVTDDRLTWRVMTCRLNKETNDKN
jgi:hypothetical protein